MPFKLRKAPKRPLYWVVDDKGKKQSKDPMPMEKAREQQKALQASENRGGMQSAKPLVPSANSAFRRPVRPAPAPAPAPFIPPALTIPSAPVKGKRRKTRLERAIEEFAKGRRRLPPIPEIEGEGKKVGSGAQPPRDVMLAIAKQSQETKPAHDVAGQRLAVSTPTIKIQEKDGTAIVGIRGTYDKTDVKADAAVAVGTLSSTQRYKKDAATVRAYRASHPDYSVQGVGHSLGGAILDQFLKEGLVTSGVSYNPAVQTGDYDRPLANQRVYNEGDPLYQLSGKHTQGVEVRKEEKSLPRRLVSAIPYFGRLQDAYQSHKLDSFRGGAEKGIFKTALRDAVLPVFRHYNPALTEEQARIELRDHFDEFLESLRRGFVAEGEDDAQDRIIENALERVMDLGQTEPDAHRLMLADADIPFIQQWVDDQMMFTPGEETEPASTQPEQFAAMSPAFRERFRGRISVEGEGRTPKGERVLSEILALSPQGRAANAALLVDALEPGVPKRLGRKPRPIGRRIEPLPERVTVPTDIELEEMSTAPEVVDPIAELEAEQQDIVKQMVDLSVKMLGASEKEREALVNQKDALREKGYAIEDQLTELKGSGKSLVSQLAEAGLTEAAYLRKAKMAAKKAGYDPKKLVFAKDGEHKLSQDGVKFGRVGQGDFLIWSALERKGKAPKGKAKEKRETFRKSHLAMKGKWKSNKMSPNWLAINILW